MTAIFLALAVLFFISGCLYQNYCTRIASKNLSMMYLIIGSKQLSEGKAENAKIEFSRSIETNIHQCESYLFLSEIYQKTDNNLELEMLKAARKGCHGESDLKKIEHRISELQESGVKGEPNLFIWPDELK
jgi:Tfp pilus assembly protein PilF